jgi:putative transposase
VPRPHRIQVAGGLYHVTTRGNRGQPIVHETYDYELFLWLIGRVARQHEWQIHAYCVMPNHYHLLLTTVEPNISAGMHALNGRYARAFNDRHGLTGHVFERRFHGQPIERESHALMVGRYIALNPVRGGLCELPEDWPWSSYAATIGARRARSFLSLARLLIEFGPGGLATRRAAYRRFVESAFAGSAAA